MDESRTFVKSLLYIDSPFQSVTYCLFRLVAGPTRRRFDSRHGYISQFVLGPAIVWKGRRGTVSEKRANERKILFSFSLKLSIELSEIEESENSVSAHTAEI